MWFPSTTSTARARSRLQPEGGYDPIDPADEGYAKILASTDVFRIDIEEMTGKFKFAQNRSDEQAEKIMQALRERGRPLDGECARLIGEYRPGEK